MGMSIGSTLGDLRLDEELMKEVGDGVEKGFSALLAIVQDDKATGIKNADESSSPRIFQVNLPAGDEQVLKMIFHEAREDL